MLSEAGEARPSYQMFLHYLANHGSLTQAAGLEAPTVYLIQNKLYFILVESTGKFFKG